MSVLSRILSDKRREVARSKKQLPPDFVRKAALALPKKKNAFVRALRSAKGMAVIAEIKRRSPSKGLIRADFNVTRIARQYAKGGAAALSVLTDKKYFGGAPEFLVRVKNTVNLPVLRKDFIVDEYQIFESRLLGADAVLLIAAALTKTQMRRFHQIAAKLGLDTLFEVHNGAELDKVLPLKPALVGVNNRDLRTFEVDLGTTEKLSKRIPKKVLFVSESGIFTGKDLKRLRACGARAVLVGESLMRAKDPGAALKRLLGEARGTR